MTVQGRLQNGAASPLAKPVVPGSFAAVAVISAAALFAVIAVLDGIQNLYTRWRYEEEYGFGFLAAAVVAFIVWRQWNLIRSLSGGSRWPGICLVFAAQACGLIGILGESYFIEQISLILTFLGLAIVLCGMGPARIFFPLSIILLLTVPLPYTLQAIVTLKLQLLSTDLGVAAIRALDIPVFVEGNIIDLGTYKLQVAEACSGLRYLLPMTCISCILAYLYQAPAWKKAIVVLSAAPVTVLINGFRIAFIGVLVERYGSGMAEGFLHEFEGWVIFLVGALLLGLEMLALEGFRLSRINVASLWDDPVPNSTKAPIRTPFATAIAVAAVCLAAVMISSGLAYAHAHAPIPSRQTFAMFPPRVGAWQGKEARLEPDVVAALKATDTYIADFSETSSKSPVNLFVAYYDSMSKGAAIHSPRVCLPGSGWEFASFEERRFDEVQPGAAGTYNRVTIQKGSQKILMYYWFQLRERRIANEFSMKYYLLVDSFRQSRRDGALVRIFTPVMSGMPDAEARLQAFTKVAVPQLEGYLPK